MTRVYSIDGYEAALDAALDRLRNFAPIEKVILFGSRARGDHHENSDWDLCVLLDDDIPSGIYTPRRMWEAVRDLGLPIQIAPMRIGVFEARRRDINALAHDVAEEGIILFDKGLKPRP
ncbi:nucleotidyltransferase domain-containing protein [Methylobacterium fujisawaense]|uniref:nucleotidyltransferase domain-containing protein n=1 Tax=Methylobacterium fujisawaense TaxID=107400 RepID=UPI00313BD2A4